MPHLAERPPPSSSPPAVAPAARALPFVLAGVLLALELGRRIFGGYVPHDFAAYLAAADTFSRGLDPYGDAIFDSSHYRGYPYIYPPASLYPLALLAHLPSALIAALDAVARMVIFVWSLDRLREWLRMDRELTPLLFAGFFFTPFAFDYLTGNAETYMFFGFLAIVGLARRPGSIASFAGGVAAGWLLCVKPMWLIPATAALVALRGWAVLAGVLAGTAAAVAVSTADMELAKSWLERVGDVRSSIDVVSMFEHSLWLYGMAVAAWVATGLWILRVHGFGGDAWIYACTAIAIWPRSDLYSYMVVLPVLLWLWRKLGGPRALLVSLPLITPLPLLVAAYDRLIMLAVALVWAFLCASLVARLLLADARMARESTASYPD